MKRGIPRPVYDCLQGLRKHVKRAQYRSANVPDPVGFSMSTANARALARELGYPEDVATLFKGLPIVCDRPDSDPVVSITMSDR